MTLSYDPFQYCIGWVEYISILGILCDVKGQEAYGLVKEFVIQRRVLRLISRSRRKSCVYYLGTGLRRAKYKV